MEEQLISFETVKIAKEKGFGGEGLTTPNGYFRGNNLCNIPCNNKSDFCGKDAFSAPTQSLLQKWLREEYEIHLVCWWYDKEDKFYTELGRRKKNSIKVQTGNVTNLFDTYENALEAGLLEALKLI